MGITEATNFLLEILRVEKNGEIQYEAIMHLREVGSAEALKGLEDAEPFLANGRIRQHTRDAIDHLKKRLSSEHWHYQNANETKVCGVNHGDPQVGLCDTDVLWIRLGFIFSASGA